MPINHTYSCPHAFYPCAQNWSGMAGKGRQRMHATDPVFRTGIQVSDMM